MSYVLYGMCGRYSIHAPIDEIEEYYDARFVEAGYAPHYNAAPTQSLPVILDQDPQAIQLVEWGLHPAWFKFQKGLINVKSETLAEKPFMRRYLAKRCLIPATGFFEWKAVGYGTKIPHFIYVKDQPIFSFAGVWSQEKGKDGKPIDRFAIITTSPNDTMSGIHNRMPVVLTKQAEQNWLLKDLPTEYALQLLRPYPNGALNAYPISLKVNNPRNDSPGLLSPAFG